MKSYQEENNKDKNLVREQFPDYEKAETDLLRDALKRSYTERFDKMMQLIKQGIMFKNAKIIPPQ